MSPPPNTEMVIQRLRDEVEGERVQMLCDELETTLATQPETKELRYTLEEIRERLEGLRRFVPRLAEDPNPEGAEFASIGPHAEGDLLRRADVLAAFTQPQHPDSETKEGEDCERCKGSGTELYQGNFEAAWRKRLEEAVAKIEETFCDDSPCSRCDHLRAALKEVAS